ncbi:hypothetical protein SKAU_G00009740 [Synaphobranchus kaupii]|uniref:Uncharacterized protein n=1 Tax=Synaphobranchus kaupii TaxID=118154 RepID=A0A9Q1GAZ0_SYNKA|nr:hypothetical protein SKAU_G00009740 [Synaphobranchus kaupii]
MTRPALQPAPDLRCTDRRSSIAGSSACQSAVTSNQRNGEGVMEDARRKYMQLKYEGLNRRALHLPPPTRPVAASSLFSWKWIIHNLQRPALQRPSRHSSGEAAE